MTDSLWYPSVEDVIAVHNDIITEYADTQSGVHHRGDIEFAINYIQEGNFETVPATIHEKAFHLLRLLVANHPFVDANKRTALNTIVVFYFLNGYRLEYDDEVRRILKRVATEETKVDETKVDEAETIEYLRTHTQEIDLGGEIDDWRDELIQYGLDQLTDDSA